MPHLKLIVVDEEHDPSYKQQEGARYSARDLAVYRGKLDRRQGAAGVGHTLAGELAGAVTRAATSGWSWLRASGQGRLPSVRLVDMNLQPKQTVFSVQLLDAIQQRIARGEQSLVFLNRRGYAPVLACSACDWKSECPNCSAFRVFHKIDRTLRCHHCGYTERVPRACPSCGNVDIAPLGRGTERLEEHLGELLADVKQARRPGRAHCAHGRRQHALQGRAGAAAGARACGRRRRAGGHADGDQGPRLPPHHAGGRPQRGLGPVLQRLSRARAAVRPADAGGRPRRPRRGAGRRRSEMWVQTWHPQHPLFAALRRHDYPGFAAQQLKEREQAGMPPFGFQALVRAEARTQEAAQAFLNAASSAAPGHRGGRSRHAVFGRAHEHPACRQRRARADAGGKRLARCLAALSGGLAAGAAGRAPRKG